METLNRVAAGARVYTPSSAVKNKMKHVTGAILTALLCSAAFTSVASAHEGETQAPKKDMKAYFESLDASRGMPKGMTQEYIANAVKKGGGTSEDVKFLISTFETDICSFDDMKNICAYMGRDTLYKVSNVAWKAKSAGASNDEIAKIVAPILEYGITKNLEELYGDKGLKDADFEKLTRQINRGTLKKRFRREGRRSIPNKRMEQMPQQKKGDGASRWLCLGLKADADTQTISSTNPIYGRKYRLVTCAAGLNKRWAWRFLWWDFSAQGGAVLTHSRFARRIGLWHSTGADSNICATGNALGNSQTKCNNYSWSTPVVIRARFIFNQPAGVVFAKGHAHKLGRQFNTHINF